jgi:hypothetical protein
MDGQTALTNLRRDGRVPSVGVVIHVSPLRLWAGWTEPEQIGAMHAMSVEPGENIDRLDLRCVVGLKVFVSDDPHASEERAVRAVCAACVAAGAKVVIGATHAGRSDLAEPWLFDYTKGA